MPKDNKNVLFFNTTLRLRHAPDQCNFTNSMSETDLMRQSTEQKQFLVQFYLTRAKEFCNILGINLKNELSTAEYVLG